MIKGWRVLFVVVLQTLSLAAILTDRALILARGREIVLKSEPIDPRDLFRGDFVVLSYPAARFDVGTVAGDNHFSAGDTAYVVMGPAGDAWMPRAIYRERLDGATLAPDEAMVKARVLGAWRTADRADAPCPQGCEMVTLGYGVESYFVPEGTGRTLEEARDDARLDVVLAVRADGQAAIKALRLDGRTFAREGIL